MQTTNIVDFARRDGMTDALTDLLRTGATFKDGIEATNPSQIAA